MAEPYVLPTVNPWVPVARPAKRPLSGFIPGGPSKFLSVPPPGNPADVSSVVIQQLYKDTPVDAVIPPGSSSAPIAAPTVTITSFSFAGAEGSTSAQPTWNWVYGGGPAASYTWTVFGDASATPTTVIASGTTPITSYVYTGATVANYYYKITVSATNTTASATASDTRQNVAAVAPPTVTLTSFGFAGVAGSTSAQPTWNWTYGGGAATSYVWTVFGDASATPTTVLATGTTPITSYAYTGATVGFYYYKITVSATNATATGSASYTQRNSPIVGPPSVTITSFSFAGVQGSTSAQPTWNWSYGGGLADTYTWTVFGDASTTPTTIIASGTTPITSYAYTAPTVANYYYKITVTATNPAATASASDVQANTLGAPAVTITSSSFAGVQGSTSAQPTWNWTYGGGPAAVYTWVVYGDASATPTTVLVSGTTPITSYAYAGATVANYYYKLTISVSNATAAASASDTLSNVGTTPTNIVATGGTITTVAGVRYHRFTSDGTFAITSNVSRIPVDIFAIGGGGGGGVCCGGGGAGGIAVRAQLIFDPGAPSQLGSYAVVVGTGGLRAIISSGPTIGQFATEGGATTITNPSSQVISCQGGGVGSTSDYLQDGSNVQFPTTGGGGGAYYTDAVVGATSYPTMGFPLPANITYYSNGIIGGSGCDFFDATNLPAGGGGAGILGNGTSVSSGTSDGGDGGAGVIYAGTVYGAGGGGAAGNPAVGFGGTGLGGRGGGPGGGGGNGASFSGAQAVSGQPAPVNSGGGGGGGIWFNGSVARGGNGAKGIAIFSYPVY